MKLTELQSLTKQLRKFDPSTYIPNKIMILNHFFRSNKLDSVILGMSGGVDSAAVLGLLLKASRQADSPIKKIWPLLIPIYGDGVTGQAEGAALAVKQCEAFGISYKIADLTEAHKAYICHNNSWANGQLACILRTPCLYYHAAILQVEGFHSIVVGTTDRDEGAYIGFYGKASDAMVDLQPIADIHKSEVQAISRLLGVIPEITERTPTGDVWDGATSETMIGAPLWFVEMYLLIKEHSLEKLQEELNEEDAKLYNLYSGNVEKLHARNLHKYQVGLPSRFIDILPRAVPGGWGHHESKN